MEMDLSATRVEIRGLEPADAGAVSLLITLLGYQRSSAEVRQWIETLGREGREQAAFVALLDGELAGWIEISIERRLQSPPFAFIGGLVVKDGLRSRGIGRRLCAHAESWSWERGVDTLRVNSRSTRADAHRFYLRDGYRVVKTSLVFEKSRPR